MRWRPSASPTLTCRRRRRQCGARSGRPRPPPDFRKGGKPVPLEITPDLVDTVRAIALEAGRAILDVYHSDFTVRHKGDRSPVTEADERAETLIINAIRSRVGDHFPIVAEEAAEAGSIPEVGDAPFWLVDPLDGTKQFVNRQGEFTVNIALIEHRLPQLGVIHAPAIGATYWGSAQGAFAETEGAPARAIACRPLPEKRLVAVASRSHRNVETDSYLASHDVAEIMSSGSSIKFCLVASGRADVYPRLGRTMEWDTAAGHAIVRFAGGTVTDMAGIELLYAKPGFENPSFVARGAPPVPPGRR
ncbi:MAG: 3'(2'),5'-bisphosphate nucleotidase [Rhodospirillales bacterium]|nr:MAG: 3'(2'),5'-bisphosphate nucleotidase [Rhodospirillales bacterium]